MCTKSAWRIMYAFTVITEHKYLSSPRQRHEAFPFATIWENLERYSWPVHVTRQGWVWELEPPSWRHPGSDYPGRPSPIPPAASWWNLCAFDVSSDPIRLDFRHPSRHLCINTRTCSWSFFYTSLGGRRLMPRIYLTNIVVISRSFLL